MSCILVVDDDPILLALAEEMLTAEGHDVRLAASGREALTLAGTIAFDLVISDVLMPDVDGIELIVALRARGVAAPVLAISGGGVYALRDVLDWARAAGAAGALTKPLRRDGLIAEVNRLLGRGSTEPSCAAGPRAEPGGAS